MKGLFLFILDHIESTRLSIKSTEFVQYNSEFDVSFIDTD
jgi:hypothetical protein